MILTGMTQDFYEDLRGDDTGWREKGAETDLEESLKSLSMTDQDLGYADASAAVTVEYAKG
jgi:hypothetical protein